MLVILLCLGSWLKGTCRGVLAVLRRRIEGWELSSGGCKGYNNLVEVWKDDAVSGPAH